jgi:hypothetical protein
MTMDDREKKTRFRIWMLLTIGPLLLYWLSIGPFFHWEQSARTQKEYLARKRLEHRIYAPIIWLEKCDGTGTVSLLNYLSIQPWVNIRFDHTKLPAE